jgi:hypothetical protein
MFRPCLVIFRESFFVIVSEFTPSKTTQYTVNSTFSLNYKLQPLCKDNKKVLPEDDPAGSKHVGVCND